MMVQRKVGEAAKQVDGWLWIDDLVDRAGG